MSDVTVQDVINAIATVQPEGVDGGYSLRRANQIADAFRDLAPFAVGSRVVPLHDMHALWLLEAEIERCIKGYECGCIEDCEREQGCLDAPIRYVDESECAWCAPAEGI